jgi:hypothetical protein
MIQLFGIRHHGPGSARSLLLALDKLKPDGILVEGPPDAASLLPLLTHADMRPPVALLVYAVNEPQQAAYFPFAEFSPEWQALSYGLQHGLEVRLIDLPQANMLALGQNAAPILHPSQLAQDPLVHLAQAAGYEDGERWWEHLVEQRQNRTGLFTAILEAMRELRQQTEREEAATTAAEPATAVGPKIDLNQMREAHMRQAIRTAQHEGLARLAVVCGAWHAPALVDLASTQADAALLKGLPKLKVAATWAPWSYSRLSAASGYGAGVTSPGWYHHLWQVGKRYGGSPEHMAQVTTRWLIRVARLLREQELDVSTAHVIEAVRLAEALAALRGRPLPDLLDLSEATLAVLCGGNDAPLQLIHQKLVVGERMGKTPSATPLTPLQQAVQQEQKRLRLLPTAEIRTLDLDLRQTTDLSRSHLLHRLDLLGIAWGKLQRATGKGTFRELWQVQWQPEFTLRLIEASAWGNTLPDAATTHIQQLVEQEPQLPVLTELLQHALLAALPAAVQAMMQQMHAQAALVSDIALLMEALPPLAQVARYGNVRQTDATLVAGVIDGFVARIAIGLPNACASLNDEAAQAMLARLLAVNPAIVLLQKEAHMEQWQTALRYVADQQGVHGLVAGFCCRLLLDQRRFDAAEGARRLHFALSLANEPSQTAHWLDGFLQGSGQLLLHDAQLWQLVNQWVMGLADDHFVQALPLLRRTFARFPAPERRQMGERVTQAGGHQLTSDLAGSHYPPNFDHQRAEAALEVLAQLLGLTVEPSSMD